MSWLVESDRFLRETDDVFEFFVVLPQLFDLCGESGLCLRELLEEVGHLQLLDVELAQQLQVHVGDIRGDVDPSLAHSLVHNGADCLRLEHKLLKGRKSKVYYKEFHSKPSMQFLLLTWSAGNAILQVYIQKARDMKWTNARICT